MRILSRLLRYSGVAFLILITLSFIIFFTASNLRIKEITEKGIEHSLGIKVSIDKIDFSPLLAHIELDGVTIYNPAGFVEGELAYIKSLHFMFDPLEIIIQKKPNIYLLALDLERLNVIKSKEGKVNIKEILPIKEESAPKEAGAPFYFDVVVLNIGEVRYIDYTGSVKKEHKYHIGIKDAAFVGLEDEKEIVKIVVYKAIENTDIGKLINLAIIPVVSQIGDTVDAAWGTAKTGMKGTWEIANLPLKLLFGKH